MGAFLAHEEPAHYNFGEHIFMPPRRTMCFNPGVTVDDALLLSAYIDSEQLSYEEAGKEMRKDITTLRDALSQNSVVRMGELGTFYMNIKGDISFEVDANGIDDPSNFGFEPFAIPLLRECEEKKIIIKRRDLGKYIAAVAAIILTFIFVTPMSDSAFKQNMQASFTGFASGDQISLMQQLGAVAPRQATTEIANCDITPLDVNGNMSAAPVVEQETIAVSAAATESAAQEVAPALVITNEKIYHIIVASSPNESNAQLAIKELSAKMDAAYTIVEGSGRHRISIGGYTSHREAQEAITQIKSTFPDAWILPATVK